MLDQADFNNGIVKLTNLHAQQTIFIERIEFLPAKEVPLRAVNLDWFAGHAYSSQQVLLDNYELASLIAFHYSGQPPSYELLTLARNNNMYAKHVMDAAIKISQQQGINNSWARGKQISPLNPQLCKED